MLVRPEEAADDGIKLGVVGIHGFSPKEYEEPEGWVNKI
jgi:hypothetical protein